MSGELLQIATRIRALREEFHISQEEMARDAGVPLADYREYEATGENIPISMLYRISHRFHMDVAEILTDQSHGRGDYAICRRGNGEAVGRFGGYYLENLAGPFLGRLMEPLLVTLKPTDRKAALVTHRGQEFNLVLEGTVVVTYGDEEHVLREGDAIYFDPAHPHGQQAIGSKKARFLTIIVE